MSATQITLIHDDCKVALRRLIDEGVRVHSIVTDPPYGLVSIQKRFGNGQAAARTEGNDGSFSRLSGGFMNQQWDGSGIELDVELWELCREILLPGGYLLAFSSPRTGHRMACTIEDAGFIIHPFIGWAYGSGFPKAKAADKFIDKHLKSSGYTVDGSYIPATPEAAQWRGYAYGGQARKPALEPIYVAQKPFSEKNGAANILKHGVGAVNIDGCRVTIGPNSDELRPEGSYPANLIHDCSPEAIAQFPNSGEGSAANFFECYRYLCETCSDQGVVGGGVPGIDAWQEACPDCLGQSSAPSPFDAQTIFYNAKAGKADRAGSRHPTVKPIALMRSLVRHVTPPGGTTLDPFAGTGTTGVAAQQECFNAILIEAHGEYIADIKTRFCKKEISSDFLAIVGYG